MLRPSSDTSLGGMDFSLPPKNMLRNSVCQDVVAMMAERDLGRSQFAGDAIQHAAAQARTQRTGGLACGDHALDDGIGVLVLDVEGHVDAAQVVGQHVGGKARLLLVEVDRDDVEADRRVLAQEEQDVEQGEGILAAGKADHDLVAGFDHVEVGDGLPDFAAQALGQFVGFEGCLPGLAGGWRGIRMCGKRCVHAVSAGPPQGGSKPRYESLDSG